MPPPSSPRPTTTKTFRIFKDQLQHLESHNPRLGSFFVRFLIDAWTKGQIPISLREKYFQIRKDEIKRYEDIEKQREKRKQKVGK
jgi:hypothetical protein